MFSYEIIIHAFFISNIFISNARLKLAKSQANAKQNPEAELLVFEIIHIFYQRYDPKVLGYILKNKQKNNCVCIHEIIGLFIMKMKMKMKKRLHRYDKNSPKPRYSKYKNYINMMLLICINQHLSNI